MTRKPGSLKADAESMIEKPDQEDAVVCRRTAVLNYGKESSVLQRQMIAQILNSTRLSDCCSPSPNTENCWTEVDMKNKSIAEGQGESNSA